MTKTILIYGMNGQVGHELFEMIHDEATASEFTVVGLNRYTDLTKPHLIVAPIKRIKPYMIVNCAAYTDVEGAETHSVDAHLINKNAVHIMVEAAKEVGCGVIHYSTDYVFDGKKKGAYISSDMPNPLNVYGRSKFAGEGIFNNLLDLPWAVIRTSWVYSSRRKNFVRSVIRLAKEKKDQTITVIDDQRGCPSSAREIARGTINVIERLTKANSGIYHLAGKGSASWYEFAKEIIGQMKKRGMKVNCAGLKPIPSDAYKTIAKRPANGVLNCRSFEEVFKFERKPWKESLGEVMDELCKIHQ